MDENNKKYKVSIKTSDSLPYVSNGDKLEIGYVNKNKNENNAWHFAIHRIIILQSTFNY